MYNGASVTFVYNIEFAWLATHVNHFHLGGGHKHQGVRFSVNHFRRQELHLCSVFKMFWMI